MSAKELYMDSILMVILSSGVARKFERWGKRSIFPHRQRFELFGRLNIKTCLTKMNIFFGIWLQMLCHIVINLGVDTCLMCFMIVFCSFRVERCSINFCEVEERFDFIVHGF